MNSTDLTRKICPGCGRENPQNSREEYFACAHCEWESESGLPDLQSIALQRVEFTDCSNVNLAAFLKTLLRL